MQIIPGDVPRVFQHIIIYLYSVYVTHNMLVGTEAGVLQQGLIRDVSYVLRLNALVGAGRVLVGGCQRTGMTDMVLPHPKKQPINM